MKRRRLTPLSVVMGMSLVTTLRVPCALSQSATGSLSTEAQEAVGFLEAEDPYTRQQAFLRLEALREPATTDIVRTYLVSRNASTRAWSVRALAAIEGSNAISTLGDRLVKDRHPYVRVSALLALEPFVEQAPSLLETFIRALRDRHPEVRMAAVDAVSRIEHPKAREAIQTRWKRERNRDVRRVLEQAIKRLGRP